MHLGFEPYVAPIAYIGFWVLCVISLVWRPRWGLYYMILFLPFRTMRNRFESFPLGPNMLTILVIAVVLGAIFQRKHLPKSKLYLIWLAYGVYLYFSMWLGFALGNTPAPVWLSDKNFEIWKDYMVIPLVLVATTLLVEDRKTARMVIILTALSVLGIDWVSVHSNAARTMTEFDEAARSAGPLAAGPNGTGAYLAQMAMFIWGFVQFVKAKKYKLIGYALIGYTLFSAMYTFSRGAYAAILASVLVLGIVKDRKLLVIFGVFLLTWQMIVPNSVRERVTMTRDANGQLEASAQERVDLWKESWDSFVHSPIVGDGFASFRYGHHVVSNLNDTHNMYVKVMVETGVIGLIMFFMIVQQMFALGYRLFRRARDPMYRGLGLGLFLATCSCVIANCFGDRWTYLEITGPLFVLIGVAVRAAQFTEIEQAPELTTHSRAHLSQQPLAVPPHLSGARRL
ncbi:MAG: O-antigen ligase family protein [Terracidiphilus sp.]